MRPLIGLFFKALSYLIGHLPKGVRAALGNVIGVLWFDILRIRRDVAIANLEIAFPEKNLAERTEIARRSLKHMGQTIVEYTLFPFFRKKDIPKRFVFEGLEHIERALAQGKGAILLTLHLGNGDFAIAALSQMGLPINLISKEFKSRWLNDLWFGMRRKHGTRFISAEKSSFDILRAFKRNEIVIFVLDQFMGPPVGVRTRFFNKETGTAAGCALMASRTKVPVILSSTFRLPDGRHVIQFEAPFPQLDDGPRAKDIAQMTQSYTDKIESIVRRHPDQWMWIHRRWKEFRD
jgi:KDO2-lipid IV(A) lauroyltransferase